MAFDGLLSQIANPQMADIAGAIDYREKRLQDESKRQKDAKMKELMGQAIPHLREGSVLQQMAKEDPERFLMFTKAVGIPIDQASQLDQMSKDVRQISKIMSTDPEGAIGYADNLAAEREKMGLDSSRIRGWVDLARTDSGKAGRAMTMLDESLNRDLIDQEKMAERKMRIGERQVDLQEAELGLKAKQLAMGGGQGDVPASLQEIAYYNSLPEGAEKEGVGRKFGLISREGQQLSSYTDKALGEAIDSSNSLSSDAGRYRAIASDLMANAKNMKVGALSSMSEYVKDFTGGQDDITSLRKQALQIVNGEAIKNLPAGSATEKDVAMAVAPLPKENADPVYIAKWLQSFANLNEKAAEYNAFKANYISEKGHQRDLLSAWKNRNGGKSQSAQPANTQPAQQIRTPDINALLEKY